MRRPGQGSFDTRALEFAVAAIAVFLGADAVRTAFGPLWKNLSLLLGI
jgi:hypothetical protein